MSLTSNLICIFSLSFLIFATFAVAPSNKLSFADPSLANLVLKELDVFEPWDNYPRSVIHRKYKNYFIGALPDHQYCDKHRAYWTENPNYVFTQTNYMSSYWDGHFVRKYALDHIATDVNPKIHFRHFEATREYPVAPETSLIITAGTLYHRRRLGQQLSCLGQSSNHIPGHATLYQKDFAALNLREYAKTYESRPQCFKKFFPTSYVLYDKQHCQEFFQILNSSEYQQQKQQQNIVFIRKIVGLHAGSGVAPVNAREEFALKRFYQNGEACGKIKERALVQDFVPNPLLINGRKSDFRLYLLVASTNPLIAFYHDGYFRITLTKYDANSKEKSSLVTNSAISPELAIAKRTGSYNGKTYEELKDDQSWLFDKFQSYLLKEGLVTDPNWVDNVLRPECKKAMIHLLRMSQHGFLKRSSLFELYGVDFMLDDQLNLWFIEANALPDLSKKSPLLSQFEGKMIRDHIDVITRLLRSRMKRIFNYVNTLILRGEALRSSEDTVHIRDLPLHIQEFKEISKNRFEPEYEPLPDNGFFKIIDENFSGAKRYNNILTDECL